jgi:hypothetical protein
MPEARHQVTIGRPASEAFGFIDGLNGPKWRTGILDIAHVSGSGVGATYSPLNRRSTSASQLGARRKPPSESPNTWTLASIVAASRRS